MAVGSPSVPSLTTGGGGGGGRESKALLDSAKGYPILAELEGGHAEQVGQTIHKLTSHCVVIHL
eukprot:COSAG04_NODE_788_length_10303_cov_33.536946_8_plen_64_part_00